MSSTSSLTLAGLLSVGALTACGDDAVPSPAGAPGPAPSWLDTPLAELPERLSEVGLYPALPDVAVVAARSIAYTPRWELWSNGLSKARYLVLPEGGAVDDADRARWSFPPGTLFFKTFATPSGPVETRVMRRAEGGWEFHAYLWDAAGADAALLDGSEAAAIELTLDGYRFDHEVPARLDCRKCHESNPSEVIGFDELRLGDPLPGAGESQLEALHAAGVFAGDLPGDPDVIEAPDPTTRDVVGYLHGNCAYCHNGGSGPATSFDMRHDVVLANTVGVPTDSSASAAGVRIVPGIPEESVLFLAFSGETDDPEVKPMPPAGVQRRDAAAVERLRSWIEALPKAR